MTSGVIAIPDGSMPAVLNGQRSPRLVWSAGRRHRLRLVNITPDDIFAVSLHTAAGLAAMDADRQGRRGAARRGARRGPGRASDDRRGRNLRLRARRAARPPQLLARGADPGRPLAAAGARHRQVSARRPGHVDAGRPGATAVPVVPGSSLPRWPRPPASCVSFWLPMIRRAPPCSWPCWPARPAAAPATPPAPRSSSPAPRAKPTASSPPRPPPTSRRCRPRPPT